MYKRQLYLRSSDPLPGLPVSREASSSSPADLHVHWRRRPPLAISDASPWERVYASEEVDLLGRPLSVLDRAGTEDPVLRLTFVDDTCFWLASGATEIWAWWPDGLTSEDASTYFLGPILGYVLRLRGVQVLHASAVTDVPMDRNPGKAIAMVGPQGAGKSTTAAAFARRGHGVLSEDVCALCPAGDPCRRAFGPSGAEAGVIEVLPGYPLVRLWSDSVEMLYGSPEVLPLLTPTWDKRYLPLEPGAAGFCDTPLPRGSIVFLAPREDSDAPRVEDVPPAQALIHLVGNTYRNLLLDRDQRASEFRFLHRLLETVPVRRAVPHTDPAYLEGLLELLAGE